MGKGVSVWEQTVYGKSLHLPLNFIVNLKLLKKKVLKKNRKHRDTQIYTSHNSSFTKKQNKNPPKDLTENELLH